MIYALPPNQDIYLPDEIKNDEGILFYKGIPSFEDFKDGQPRLLVIDDQAQECGAEIVALFTRGSHHFNISVIVLTQNIFISNPGFRTMSLNTHYIVLFKNPRAKDQVSCLARQVCPDNVKFFQESYADSCKEPHSYLLMDLTQGCPEQLRYRSRIFADDVDCTTVYLPVENKKKHF